MNRKKTSSSVASDAARTLRDPNASQIQKKLAGSALSQVQKNNQTGKQMEQIASDALSSPKYSELTKKLAGSILSQSDRKR